jgi:hypothetical protein
MEYSMISFIVGIAIFLILIIASVVGLRNRVAIIHGITRHPCTGDTCPLSLDLLILNPLRLISIAPRGFYAYLMMRFIKDDGSIVHFFRGYVPSLSNTWRILDLIPSVRLFNIAISGDGIHVTDIMLPYPSFLELPGSSSLPFDTKTGEPTGMVNFLSIRRALAVEIGEKLVQSMSLAEIVKRVLVDLAFYDGVIPAKYTIALPKLLALAGIQVDGEVRIIDGSTGMSFRRIIKCPSVLGYGICVRNGIRTTWVWATMVEALLGLVYAFTSSLLPLVLLPIAYLAVISAASRFI